MATLSIFGAQWGDEGKGKVIDRLAADVDYIVRYQGGANAGHTVVVGDKTYALHLIPSGILHPGRINVIANGVAIDPISFLGEVDGLIVRGVQINGDNLVLSSNAHVIFEHHKVVDGLAERWKGEGRIGTTGRGIGPAYADKASRTGLRIADLLDPERCKERLGAALAEKNALIKRVHEAEPLDLDSQLEKYSTLADRLRPFVADTGKLLRQAYRDGKSILFEGAQGVMLDIDHGTYPFVTSSNTGTGGIPAGTGFPPVWVEKSMGIAKAYCTRVGEGPFPSELTDEMGDHLCKVGREFGTTTGRARRAGWFDGVAARYAFELAGTNSWVMTKLDVLSGLGEIQVGVAYKHDGVRYEEYPAHLPCVEDVEVEYRTLPGWNEDISDVREWDDLPANAQGYVRALGDLVGAPVALVSVGPDRAAMVTCPK
ncbi:MAG: adenylosuccinate synthase [bacterium]|nr:adenylosuccinate synthase [bacterium]